MTDAEQFCQECGLPLTLVQRVDGETSVVFEWACPTGHYWQQTPSGMTPIVSPTAITVTPIAYESE